jgi:ABC-2 type transport system permease protein
VNRRRLWTLVRREARATLRDPFTLTVLVAVPLGALLIFGFVLATDVKQLPLGVLDASDTPASRRLVADIAATRTFVPRRYRSRDAVSGASSAARSAPRSSSRPTSPSGARRRSS